MFSGSVLLLFHRTPSIIKFPAHFSEAIFVIFMTDVITHNRAITIN